MLRFFAAVAACAVMFGASTVSAEPSMAPDFAARVATTCTKDGAFGHKFGEKGPGPGFTFKPGPQWAPLHILKASYAPRSRKLIELEAWGGWESDEPFDSAKPIKKDVFDAVLKEIATTRQFARQRVRGNGAIYYSDTAAGSGYTLMVNWLDAAIHITCTDEQGLSAAVKEVVGPAP